MSFQEAATVLLREAFEGRPEGQNYTWFVEKREGIFDALDSVDSVAASKKPSEECASIAAHAYHLLFTLRGSNTALGRPGPEGTWESTWEKQEVSEPEWNDLRSKIREEYELYIAWFAANEDWSREHATIGNLALLPHVSFHLGAIRQILKTIGR